MCRENEIFLYPDIPRIEKSYVEYPAKIFVIEQRVAGEFLFRVTLDNDQPRPSYANVFTGPGASYQFDLTERGTAEGIEKIITGLREANFFIPERRDFVLGAVDVVTYPFYYALINKMDNPENIENYWAEKLWKINNNLINEFIPRKGIQPGALSIFHFNEEPIDDAPTHNIMLFGMDKQSVMYKYSHIVKSKLRINYVGRDDPVMDDRYVMATRRPEDGQPFSLSAITEILRTFRSP